MSQPEETCDPKSNKAELWKITFQASAAEFPLAKPGDTTDPHASGVWAKP